MVPLKTHLWDGHGADKKIRSGVLQLCSLLWTSTC